MSSEQTATSITVRAVLMAPVDDLFALLVDPAQHVLLDGSGTVRGARGAEPLTHVGQVFVMAMHRADLGDYDTENAVIELNPGQSVAWTTTRPGVPASGFFWRWDLRPADTGTEVTHTYDWSAVTDPAVLARVTFPRVSAAEMQATLDALAVAVHPQAG